MSKKNNNTKTSLIRNREHYEAIKRFDRKQMEEFAREIYELGYETRKRESSDNEIKAFAEKACSEIKKISGVGEILHSKISHALWKVTFDYIKV